MYSALSPPAAVGDPRGAPTRGSGVRMWVEIVRHLHGGRGTVVLAHLLPEEVVDQLARRARPKRRRHRCGREVGSAVAARRTVTRRAALHLPLRIRPRHLRHVSKARRATRRPPHLATSSAAAPAVQSANRAPLTRIVPRAATATPRWRRRSGRGAARGGGARRSRHCGIQDRDPRALPPVLNLLRGRYGGVASAATSTQLVPGSLRERYVWRAMTCDGV